MSEKFGPCFPSPRFPVVLRNLLITNSSLPGMLMGLGKRNMENSHIMEGDSQGEQGIGLLFIFSIIIFQDYLIGPMLGENLNTY
jgi:hypothetical protein